MFTSWLPSWLADWLLGWMDGWMPQAINKQRVKCAGIMWVPKRLWLQSSSSINPHPPHLHTHTHIVRASANPLLVQQVGKLVSQSLRLASCSAGISMRISRTKSKHAESRQAGKEDARLDLFVQNDFANEIPCWPSECVNIIMARARPMQTGRTARTRARATCCACVPMCVCMGVRGVLQFG